MKALILATHPRSAQHTAAGGKQIPIRSSIRNAWCSVALGLWLASTADPVLAGQAPPPGVANDVLDLPALLAQYRALGLPLPPPDAPLVKIVATRQAIVGGTEYALGFVRKAETAERGPVLLVGTQEVIGERPSTATPIDPAQIDAKDVQIAGRQSIYDVSLGIPLAIQFEARGWHDLAVAVLDRSIKTGDRTPSQLNGTGQPDNLPPKLALANVAWYHWLVELDKPESDRAAIVHRLEALVASQPDLADPAADAVIKRSLDEGRAAGIRPLVADPILVASRQKADYLAVLQETVRPSGAKPGSIEAMIDDLTEMRIPARRGIVDQTSLWSDPRISRLVLQGFAAVPALIDHLDDRRLTHADAFVIMMELRRKLSVGDYASYILSRIADDGIRLEPGTSTVRISKQNAQNWWAKVAEGGDARYMLAHALTGQPTGRNTNGWDETAFRIIAARYTEELPGLYQRMTESFTQPEDWYMTERAAHIVGESALSKERKLAIFQALAQRPQLAHGAIAQLAGLKEDMAIELLTQWFENLPKTFDTTHTEPQRQTLADLARLTDSPRVWAALLAATRRAEPGMRLALVYDVNDPEDRLTDLRYIVKPAAKSRAAVLAYLSEFLDDAGESTIQQVPTRFTPTVTVNRSIPDTYPTIAVRAVRNLAAVQIGKILALPAVGRDLKTVNADEWTKYRAEVRRALDDELRR